MDVSIAPLLIAAASSCLMVPDPDQRAYCLAKENHQATAYAAIADMDLRIRCRVELGQDKSQCVSISDPTDRALCQAGSGK